MQLSDVVCESIQLQAGKTGLRAFAIDLAQELNSQELISSPEEFSLRKGERAVALTPRAINEMLVCFRNWRRLSSLAIWILA
mgnify:CR=1 FL=1